MRHQESRAGLDSRELPQGRQADRQNGLDGGMSTIGPQVQDLHAHKVCEVQHSESLSICS